MKEIMYNLGAFVSRDNGANSASMLVNKEDDVVVDKEFYDLFTLSVF